MTERQIKKGLSQAVVIAIIAAIVSLGNTWMTVRNQTKIDRVVDKVDTVHSVVNHRMDEMLRLVQQKSTAEGVIQGKAQQVTSDSLYKRRKK